jgi:hypothetical protein
LTTGLATNDKDKTVRSKVNFNFWRRQSIIASAPEKTA